MQSCVLVEAEDFAFFEFVALRKGKFINLGWFWSKLETPEASQALIKVQTAVVTDWYDRLRGSGSLALVEKTLPKELLLQDFQQELQWLLVFAFDVKVFLGLSSN